MFPDLYFERTASEADLKTKNSLNSRMVFKSYSIQDKTNRNKMQTCEGSPENLFPGEICAVLLRDQDRLADPTDPAALNVFIKHLFLIIFNLPAAKVRLESSAAQFRFVFVVVYLPKVFSV